MGEMYKKAIAEAQKAFALAPEDEEAEEMDEGLDGSTGGGGSSRVGGSSQLRYRCRLCDGHKAAAATKCQEPCIGGNAPSSTSRSSVTRFQCPIASASNRTCRPGASDHALGERCQRRREAMGRLTRMMATRTIMMLMKIMI